MEEKKENAEPKVAGNPEEPAEAQAAAGAEAVEKKEQRSFADKMQELLWGVRSFSERSQAAVLKAAIEQEERSWQN